MRTQEQIAQAAQKNGIAFKVCFRNEGYAYPHMEILMTSEHDCRCNWFNLNEDGTVRCDYGYPTKAMRNFAERLFHRCSDLHECDWTF